MDVAAWLQGLGLERYAPAFLENRIEADILPSLTLEDLRDLGVTLVGDRRRLLDAIAALGVAISTPAASAPAVTAAAPAPADAERRQLTVMFCDLVGSTALSTHHDPEDLRELIGDYRRAVADTVGHFDGFVAKYMGDGVLIYFGYPQAHEDDAEPHTQLLPRGQSADRLDYRQPRPHRSLGIVLMRLRVAEIDQYPVTHVLGNKAVEAADCRGNRAMVVSDQLPQILRVKTR